MKPIDMQDIRLITGEGNLKRLDMLAAFNVLMRNKRNIVIEEVAVFLKQSYPENANTNAFCAAIRSMKNDLSQQT